ncbi:hypothetical protein OROMI_000995 [Orobanche minor]
MGDYGDAMMRDQNAAVQARTKAQNRANVMQLKLIGQSHPTGLTSNLLKLFEPRPPLEYKPPPEKRKCPSFTGMAQFVSNFAEPGDPQYAIPVKKGETPAQKRARIHEIRLEAGAKKAAEGLEKYDPNNDPNISGDPYKTLFVARLNYETTESKIKREFEAYGPIKRVRLVMDKETNKPRGYAFIEYVHTRDMKAAYKQADGRKIDNRRVLVDVERGRTVPNWRPRRLGGGLGTTRGGGEEVNQRVSVRGQTSEEPRIRDEQNRDREKSHDRGRDRERERAKSRERSHERPRDRDYRDDRLHKDRDRTRDKDRDHGRDRDRERDRTREHRVRDHRGRYREHTRDHHHEVERETDRDRDGKGGDKYRERSRDRGYAHDDSVDFKRERDPGERRKYGSKEAGEDNHEWADHGHGDYDYYEHQDRDGQYADPDRRGDYDRDNDRYDRMDEDGYGYDRGGSEPRDELRASRSLSRGYEH